VREGAGGETCQKVLHKCCPLVRVSHVHMMLLVVLKLVVAIDVTNSLCAGLAASAVPMSTDTRQGEDGPVFNALQQRTGTPKEIVVYRAL
jgi:hypothetical protein